MAAMKFYTTERVGKTRSRTPEGFLLCESVPVARTGQMIYGPGEVPITPGPDGLIRVDRDEEQVFSSNFLASLNGKPVVNNHPDVDVDPTNWKELSCGVGMNPRRGTGIDSDLVIMDLLVTDKDAIALVESGKDEISLGYEAEYEEIERGRGRQLDLIANHIALVDSGRCGPRCAIGDHQPEGVPIMATTKDKKHRISDALSRLMTAFRAKDEKGAEEAANELEKEVKDAAPAGADGEGTEIHIHTGETKDDDGAKWEKNDADHEEFRKRLEALEAKLGKTGDADPDEDDPDKKKKEETKDEDDPEAKEKADKEKAADELLEEEGGKGTAKAKDSTNLTAAWQQTISLAEILVPGIRVPTFDSATDPHKTLDAMCRHRRNALDLAYATPEGRGLLDEVNAGQDFDLTQMSCKAVKTLFIAAGTAKKALNNTTQRRTGDLSKHQQGRQEERQAPRTLAEINEFNRKHYQ